MHGGKELQHRPSISSVHLQKILYFNAVLSLLFAAVMGAVAVEKAVAYHRYTPIAAIILWFLFEPTRLYNGFKGNLTEKVSNGFQILFYIYGSYLEFQHKRCICSPYAHFIPWHLFYYCQRIQVPNMATYLLMTLFPQSFLVIYLGFLQRVEFPIDPILGSFMVISLILQLILGAYSLRSFINTQTSQFMRLVAMND